MTDREIAKVIERLAERDGWATDTLIHDYWSELNKVIRNRPGWTFFSEIGTEHYPMWVRGDLGVTVVRTSTGNRYTTILGGGSLYDCYKVHDVEFLLNAIEPAEAGPITYFDRASTESALLMADDLITNVEGLLRPEDYIKWQTVRALAGVPTLSVPSQ